MRDKHQEALKKPGMLGRPASQTSRVIQNMHDKPGNVSDPDTFAVDIGRNYTKSLRRVPDTHCNTFVPRKNCITNYLRRRSLRVTELVMQSQASKRICDARCRTKMSLFHCISDLPRRFGQPRDGLHIKCKNVWVWKNACLSCLSGMTLKSVIHVTQAPHFSVMQKRSLSCGIGNT